MIRVGFMVGDGKWKGGINFFENLLNALDTLPSLQITPVIITSLAPEHWHTFPPRIRACEMTLHSPPTGWLMSRLHARCRHHLGWDPVLSALLRKHHITLLSHTTGLPPVSTPALCWIPDFQHLRRPDFFSPQEVASRLQSNQAMLDKAAAVLVSSQDALGDLTRLDPAAARKAHVLPFVASVPTAEPSLMTDLAQRYSIGEPFFYVPNQFWKHKNHSLIIKALGILKQTGRRVLVICTGDTQDHRHPGHFEALMDRARSLAVDGDFRPLGLVPFADVVALMRHSVGVINPSFFEGWSTTVEEAKCLGKQLVLSDIPVHREQAPERSVYVHPEDPQALAEAMWAIASSNEDDSTRLLASQRAREQCKARQKAYGMAYHEIVLNCASELGLR